MELTVPPALTATVPGGIRAECDWPAPLDDAGVAVLAAQTADEREAGYWMPREVEWIGAASRCEKKRAGAVAVSDAQSAAAIALKRELEGLKLRGRF